MSVLTKILIFVVPLGFDTLAIAIALGFRNMRPIRPAILFAIFEMVMPLVGLLLGHVVGARFALIAALVGGIILIGLGLHAFREAAEEGAEASQLSFDSLRAAIVAGIAISTDELAIGFPMGASGLPIGAVIMAIGIQTFAVTIVGIVLGARIGEAIGRRAIRLSGTIAGLAFTGVGIWLIAEPFLSR